MVCGTLEQAGFSAVLTGGAVVSIYSENDYASYDLDIISNASQSALDHAMNDLGFTRGVGRQEGRAIAFDHFNNRINRGY